MEEAATCHWTIPQWGLMTTGTLDNVPPLANSACSVPLQLVTTSMSKHSTTQSYLEFSHFTIKHVLFLSWEKDRPCKVIPFEWVFFPTDFPSCNSSNNSICVWQAHRHQNNHTVREREREHFLLLSEELCKQQLYRANLTRRSSRVSHDFSTCHLGIEERFRGGFLKTQFTVDRRGGVSSKMICCSWH